MPTRLTSSPRMIGRDEAPGAKLEPVMPGLENNRSPSVLAGVRRSSSFGTTVTVANWSVTIGSAPSGGASTGGGVAAWSTGAAARGSPRGGVRRAIGLGAVTVIAGSSVGVWAAAGACKLARTPMETITFIRPADNIPGLDRVMLYCNVMILQEP